MAKRRPAETVAGAAGAVAGLIAYFGEITDPYAIVCLTVAVGAVPGAVTWAVNLWRSSG